MAMATGVYSYNIYISAVGVGEVPALNGRVLQVPIKFRYPPTRAEVEQAAARRLTVEYSKHDPQSPLLRVLLPFYVEDAHGHLHELFSASEQLRDECVLHCAVTAASSVVDQSDAPALRDQVRRLTRAVEYEYSKRTEMSSKIDMLARRLDHVERAAATNAQQVGHTEKTAHPPLLPTPQWHQTVFATAVPEDGGLPSPTAAAAQVGHGAALRGEGMPSAPSFNGSTGADLMGHGAAHGGDGNGKGIHWSSKEDYGHEHTGTNLGAAPDPWEHSAPADLGAQLGLPAGVHGAGPAAGAKGSGKGGKKGDADLQGPGVYHSPHGHAGGGGRGRGAQMRYTGTSY